MAIRKTCFLRFKDWTPPTPAEVRELISLTELTGSQVAELVGVASARTVRRWVGGQSPIPYSAWALLCWAAGYGVIVWGSSNE